MFRIKQLLSTLIMRIYKPKFKVGDIVMDKESQGRGVFNTGIVELIEYDTVSSLYPFVYTINWHCSIILRYWDVNHIVLKKVDKLDELVLLLT